VVLLEYGNWANNNLKGIFFHKYNEILKASLLQPIISINHFKLIGINKNQYNLKVSPNFFQQTGLKYLVCLFSN
jgi:hypothetical protein